MDHRFELDSTEARRAAETHLEGCADCRRKLDLVSRKFAALDLLRAEVHAQPALVAAALSCVKSAQPPARHRFRKGWFYAALAAAAAIVVALALPRAMDVPGRDGPRSKLGKLPGRPPAALADALRDSDQSSSDLAALRASQPFAPGSNIELNVLPTRENVQLTIYNSADLTLVREQRNLTMKKGWNWLQFMWANTLIDPTSLRIEPLDHADKIEVRALVFPPRIRELGRWLIFSEVSGEVPVEITYLTSGLSWRAFYMGTLSPDERTMMIEGYVRAMNESGEDYENAQTRLIVGKVHLLDRIAELARREHPYGSPILSFPRFKGRARSSEMNDLDLGFVSGGAIGDRLKESFSRIAPKEIKKEGLSEYFLYTIEGTETIPHGWAKRLPSIEASDVPVVNLYKYEDERYGEAVVRFLSFKNDEEHKLGATPIPGGALKVYRTVDEARLLSYVGESSFKYIPVGEDVELNLGAAENIVVRPKVMDFLSGDFQYDVHGNISGWEETREYKVEVKNTRDLSVKVEITRNFPTQHWTLEKSGAFGEYEKVDLDTAKFTIELEPRAAREFNYVLTTRHGTRAE